MPCVRRPRRGTTFGSGATRRCRRSAPSRLRNGSSIRRPEDFHAVAVEAEGRLVAALPLVRRKIAGLFDAGTMPCNEWSASGDLLLDPFFPSVLDAMAGAIRDVPWPLLWLDEAVLEAPRWRALQAALLPRRDDAGEASPLASGASRDRPRLAGVPGPLVAEAPPENGVVAAAAGGAGQDAAGRILAIGPR